jgi:8-amino-7-oxononanoate synthase
MTPPALRIQCLRQASELDATWDHTLPIPTPMQRDFLRVVQTSGVNDLHTYYLRFLDANDHTVAQANVFVSDTDFSTFDSKLPASARATIKGWFPQFMRFRIVEVGYFTMIGEGLVVRDRALLEPVLRCLDECLQHIAQDERADFLLMRDIPLSAYEDYRRGLSGLGYVPSVGFPNATLQVPWGSIDEYLTCLDSKTRLKFKNSLKLQERFGIEVDITSDFEALAPQLEQLWSAVHARAKDYAREVLNAEFFAASARDLGGKGGKGEIIRFRQGDRLIGFMLNLIGATDYIVLDWGVDYTYEHYREANLYRAATLLSLERAMQLGKQRLELGITNYTPKQTLGAEIAPLAYFLRHREDPRFSHTLARLLTDTIALPDTAAHAATAKLGTIEHDLVAFEQRVKRDQNPFDVADVLERVGNFQRANSLRLSGIYGLYPVFNCAQGSVVTLEDRRERVLLGTNSYLGLANDERVISAAEAALRRYGSGCSGSPLLNGTLDIHNQLEAELAAFTGREAVALCSTGYQTNLAAISALCGQGDVVLMDARNHRSLFDGVKLSGADCAIFRHADLQHLERLLQRTAGRRRMIITDSVFSMEGTIADLRSIVALAKAYGARLFVDESHAVGVFGPRGRGITELQGVEADVDIVMGTFSKAFAGLGGFVAGKAMLIDYIKHNAGGHIFSASLPPSVIATVLAALDIVRREPQRRVAVLERARFMATQLQALGYRAPYHGSQIVPVVLGNYTLALSAYKRFMDEGVYVNPVGPPAVPEADSGFRTSYIATHRWEDLHRAIDIFRRHRNDFITDVRENEIEQH